MLLLLLACEPAADSGPRYSRRPPDDADADTDSDADADSDADSDADADTDADGGCPEGITCIDHFPWYGSDDTTTSTRTDFDTYSCATDTDESGPEQVYRLTIPADGFLSTNLNDRGDDVDAHILSALDPDACVDRGNFAAASWVAAGTWYVVIDSWVDGGGTAHPGAYDLWLNVTTPDAYVAEGLDSHVLGLGLTAFDTAWKSGDTDRFEYTIIDFSRPSDEHRQWTFDLADGSLLYSLLVAHGEGSGSDTDPRYADKFSNEDGSHMSSLGLMRTAGRFTGSHGTSLTLQGLEPGINDAVEAREIIVHGADYATQAFVDEYGYLGRSWGCPAVDPDVVDDLVGDVEDGSLYWSYYPDPAFLSGSTYL